MSEAQLCLNHALMLNCMKHRLHKLSSLDCSVIANCYSTGRIPKINFSLILIEQGHVISVSCFYSGEITLYSKWPFFCTDKIVFFTAPAYCTIWTWTVSMVVDCLMQSRSAVRHLVHSSNCQKAVLIAILVNTLSMGVEHHEQVFSIAVCRSHVYIVSKWWLMRYCVASWPIVHSYTCSHRW